MNMNSIDIVEIKSVNELFEADDLGMGSFELLEIESVNELFEADEQA